MKEKKLLKIQPLPKVLRVQAIKATTRFSAAKFITGQNEREETTQDAIVTKSAAFASYAAMSAALQKARDVVPGNCCSVRLPRGIVALPRHRFVLPPCE
jgi:hypothetical protein